MADPTFTLNNNSSYAVQQPFKVESDATTSATETLEIKPLSQTSSETVEIKPLSQTSSETVEIKPLSQTSSETLEIRPLSQTSNETVELKPIRSDANSTLDLKPVALDVCMRTGPASLPPTHICEPYQHRIGFTLLGVELFGLAWSGEQQTIIDDRAGRPVVAWGDVIAAPPRVEVDLPRRRPEHRHHHRHHGDGDGDHGLHIRLAD